MGVDGEAPIAVASSDSGSDETTPLRKRTRPHPNINIISGRSQHRDVIAEGVSSLLRHARAGMTRTRAFLIGLAIVTMVGWFVLNAAYGVGKVDTAAIARKKSPCTSKEPGWEQAQSSSWAISMTGWRPILMDAYDRLRGGRYRRPWSSDDDDTWPRPVHPPDPLLRDGWKTFYASLEKMGCRQHSPECRQVPGWPTCCKVHLMLKAKLVAFSDHMRWLGWPHWFVHSGTMLGLIREQGRLIPHDHDADILVVAKFNEETVFKNYTARMLSFNGRYPPFGITVGAHKGGKRGPFSRTPWKYTAFTGKPEPIPPGDFVSKTGDFVVAPMAEFGHMDVSLLTVAGGGYGNACQQTMSGHWRHPSAWTEKSGRPAACPFGLKLGSETYHGLNCPDTSIPWLEAAFGKGEKGWKSRAVKFGSEARWYKGSIQKKRPAMPADCEDEEKETGGITFGRRRRRRRLKQHHNKGVERVVGCHCANATAAEAAAQAGNGMRQVREVVCKRKRRAWTDKDGTQAALDRLSRAEEAARHV